MKSISLLTIALSLFNLNNFAHSESTCTDEPTTVSKTSKTGDKFRVTAETRKQYGKNYWIDLTIDGTNQFGISSIYGVYYNDGYGIKKVSHQKDYNYENTYYVTIDYEKYYFTF